MQRYLKPLSVVRKNVPSAFPQKVDTENRASHHTICEVVARYCLAEAQRKSGCLACLLALEAIQRQTERKLN